MNHLTTAQRLRFDEDGYLTAVDLLDSDQVARCRAALDAPLASGRGCLPARLRSKPHLLLHWVADLVRHPRLLEIVEDILGSDLLVWRAAFFVKPPGDAGYVAWHQDAAYWQLGDDRILTAWIALTDSSIENGCVRVVTGSHRDALAPHRFVSERDNLLLRGQTADVDIPPERVVPLQLRAGQMSLHHVRILHGSPANSSPALRAGLAVRFIVPGVRAAGPRQSATLVRGSDRFGYYDHEPAPRFDGDPITAAWHARWARRYALQTVRQLLRHPSPAALSALARLAVDPARWRTLFPARRRAPGGDRVPRVR